MTVNLADKQLKYGEHLPDFYQTGDLHFNIHSCFLNWEDARKTHGAVLHHKAFV